MTPGVLNHIGWLAPALLGLSFGGFAYTIFRAVGSGAGGAMTGHGRLSRPM